MSHCDQGSAVNGFIQVLRWYTACNMPCRLAIAIAQVTYNHYQVSCRYSLAYTQRTSNALRPPRIINNHVLSPQSLVVANLWRGNTGVVRALDPHRRCAKSLQTRPRGQDSRTPQVVHRTITTPHTVYITICSHIRIRPAAEAVGYEIA